MHSSIAKRNTGCDPVPLTLLLCLQVLHLCITVASNQDTAMGLMVMWSAMQTLFSSFFINFDQVTLFDDTVWSMMDLLWVLRASMLVCSIPHVAPQL
jgi:hypothetical protein